MPLIFQAHQFDCLNSQQAMLYRFYAQDMPRFIHG